MNKKHGNGVWLKGVIITAAFLLISAGSEGQEVNLPSAKILSVQCGPGQKVTVHIRAHCAVGIQSYSVGCTWITSGPGEMPVTFFSPKPKDIDQIVTTEHPLDNCDREHQIAFRVTAVNGKSAIAYASEPDGRCPGHTTMILRVLAPNGGENWLLGSVQTISWEFISWCITDEPNKVRITLWKNGVFRGVVAESAPAIERSFKWTVGDLTIYQKASPGPGYRIQIQRKNGLMTDRGDVPFTITELHATLVSTKKNN